MGEKYQKLATSNTLAKIREKMTNRSKILGKISNTLAEMSKTPAKN